MQLDKKTKADLIVDTARNELNAANNLNDNAQSNLR